MVKYGESSFGILKYGEGTQPDDKGDEQGEREAVSNRGYYRP